jgi:hypothetical protein
VGRGYLRGDGRSLLAGSQPDRLLARQGSATAPSPSSRTAASSPNTRCCCRTRTKPTATSIRCRVWGRPENLRGEPGDCRVHEMSVQPRLILLHKQKTSGRVRFLCLSAGVVAFKPAAGAFGAARRRLFAENPVSPDRRRARGRNPPRPARRRHRTGTPNSQAWVDTPEGDVPVLLAAFTGSTRPFAPPNGPTAVSSRSPNRAS